MTIAAGDTDYETLSAEQTVSLASGDGLAAALRRIAGALPEAAALNAPLDRYAWVGIGGPADCLVVARERATLVRAVRLAQQAGVPWRVYGGLTNVLVPDTGLRGLVVLNRARQVRFDDGCRVVADAGANVIPVARAAVGRGWGGLTWAVGLPGTLGGAVVNNAGAFGGEISRVLTAADVLLPDGRVKPVSPDWFEFRYRYSKLKAAGWGGVVLSATFQLRPGDPERLAAKAAAYTERRQRTQPPGRTLGSTFKNPPGDYAGRLIEAAGLKGARCGGIAVSEHHANFLINAGGGTAADFRALVDRIQRAVGEQFGVVLEPEIEMVPDERPPGAASSSSEPERTH